MAENDCRVDRLMLEAELQRRIDGATGLARDCYTNLLKWMHEKGVPKKTHEQIEIMTNADIDCYIASKIFGMTWKSWDKEGPAVSYEDDHGCWETDDRATGGVFDAKWVGVPDSHSWAPSECVDDAMETAKKVGGNIEISGIHDPAYYKATVWIGGKDFIGVASTPALAICRAAIYANENK